MDVNINQHAAVTDLGEITKPIVHCCYHKTGTHWLKAVLKNVSAQFGLNLQVLQREGADQQADILFDCQSHINLEKLPTYIGSHMIRDPRDMVISGYFYHLWTNEQWALQPKPKYGDKSYQQYLKSLSQEEGLLAEITRSKRLFTRMYQWNYNNPRILEVQYEHLINNQVDGFRSLFAHYGFSNRAIDQCVDLALDCGFEKVANRKLGDVQEQSVTRSGQPGQWRDYFTERVCLAFKESYSPLLIRLGYESSQDW